jgi:hypothetical protein
MPEVKEVVRAVEAALADVPITDDLLGRTNFVLVRLIGSIDSAPSGDLHLAVSVQMPRTVNPRTAQHDNYVRDTMTVELVVCVNPEDQGKTKEDAWDYEVVIRNVITSLTPGGARLIGPLSVRRTANPSKEWYLVTQEFQVERWQSVQNRTGC